MTTINKTIYKSVIEAVYEILDKAQNANEKIPALRVIRHYWTQLAFYYFGSR